MTSPTSSPASPPALPDMAAFGHVKDGLLRDLLAYYLARRDGARVPLRSRIAPMDFPKLLSNVFLYEYVAADDDFHIRLAGEEIRTMLQTTLQGAKLAEVFPPEIANVVRERYGQVCRDGSVMHNIGLVFERMGGSGQGERIVMPLADDQGVARFLLGATVYHFPQQAAASRPNVEKVTITFTPL